VRSAPLLYQRLSPPRDTTHAKGCCEGDDAIVTLTPGLSTQAGFVYSAANIMSGLYTFSWYNPLPIVTSSCTTTDVPPRRAHSTMGEHPPSTGDITEAQMYVYRTNYSAGTDRSQWSNICPIRLLRALLMDHRRRRVVP
jgi:hypothetical protein